MVSVLSLQIVTDVMCIFTYLFGLNVTIDCFLVLGRILFQPLPCNLLSVVVLVWKSSILFQVGSANWLRRASQSVILQVTEKKLRHIQALHYCALIGRELQSVEIFS